MKKKKTNTRLFIAAFVVIIGITVVNNIMREDITKLTVLNNPGVSVLETVDSSLICVFQDGQVISWDWNTLPVQQADFKVVSDRAIILDADQLAVVSKTEKKILTVYRVPDGQKQNDMEVGWQDQEVWLRISPDKNVLALIRRNTRGSRQNILLEFLKVDIDKQLLSIPVTLSITQDNEDFVDYAVDDNSVLYAVGSQKSLGRIVALDLQKGNILWDEVYENTKEFCSCLISPKGDELYAGNRDGLLYKINADTGEIVKKIQLLKDGETRPITNDYSVLNLAFSPDGTHYVATIHPKAYIIKSGSDEIVHIAKPADRLVSKITFSPDNQFIATSDIRAGYPVKIWPMPEQK